MSDNKEKCRVKPWEVRMQEYFAQGSVAMRTSAAFMAEEIADWRAAQPVVLSDEQIVDICAKQCPDMFHHCASEWIVDFARDILAAKEQA